MPAPDIQRSLGKMPLTICPAASGELAVTYSSGMPLHDHAGVDAVD
jgi:hypothetical protein